MLEPVTYEVGDRSFTGYLADGAREGRAPGILVAHEAGGLTDHVKRRAAMLAELGYVALAVDMFGETGMTLDRAREFNLALRADIPLLRRRCAAALDVLCAYRSVDPRRLAGIGFCFGGFAMIELARSGVPLAAVVGFHSGFPEPDLDQDRRIAARMLFCMGADDPVITVASRDAYMAGLGAAGVDWQLHIHGGVGHSFTNEEIDAYGLPGFAYDAVADRRSWRAMRWFLDEAFERSGDEA